MVTTTQFETTRYVMVNARTGAPVAARLEVLRSTGRRLLRLLGQRPLRSGEGVRYLVNAGGDGGLPPTWRRRAAVDIAFLDRDGIVVHALQSLATTEAGREVHSVIELPAGTLARLETRAGDVLAMYRGEEG